MVEPLSKQQKMKIGLLLGELSILFLYRLWVRNQTGREGVPLPSYREKGSL